MVMVERYGVPATRIISLIDTWEYPTHAMQPGDRIMVCTDDGMDTMIWESAMAAIKARGAEAVLCLFPRLPHNGYPLHRSLVEGSKGVDLMWWLTSSGAKGGSAGFGTRPDGTRTRACPMEEMTVEIMTEGGGSAKADDVEQIMDVERRIREVYEKTKWIHVTSAGGTDFTADISGYAPGELVNFRGGEPHGRNPKTGKLIGGTWPTGEVHVEPLPGTANGVVVWDITAHFPPGRWKDPVTLTIKDGRVTSVDGKSEAEELVKMIEKYGDENSYMVGGETSIGVNHLSKPNTFMIREEKKRYGQMHFGIGTGADRGIVKSAMRIEGIVDRVSIMADDTVICEDGKILV